MDAKQIAAMERAMEEEHRKDREALERLRRFLPSSNNGDSSHEHSARLTPTVINESREEKPNSIVAHVASIMQADCSRTWEPSSLQAQLKSDGVELRAKKPNRELNRVLRVLRGRGVIRLVRRGSGINANLYRAVDRHRETEAAS